MTARWPTAPLLALILLCAIVTTGTLGYRAIEGWSAWDALYMTVISLTTVGYRDVHPMSRAGEAFTMFVLVGGVGTVLYSFTLIGARVIESALRNPLERRRITNMLDRLEHHFIVCGYGRIGAIIVDEFRRQHVPYVVSKAGLARARGLIAAVSTDAENVYTVLSARLMQPSLYIIGRASSDESTRKIRQVGANRVISPYQIGGLHMAQLALRPAVMEFVQLATSSEFLELSMEQIEVRGDGPLAGRSIVGANLRQKFGVIVVGIRLASGRMDFNPAPDAMREAGDSLVLLGPNDRLGELATHAAAQAQPV